MCVSEFSKWDRLGEFNVLKMLNTDTQQELCELYSTSPVPQWSLRAPAVVSTNYIFKVDLIVILQHRTAEQTVSSSPFILRKKTMFMVEWWGWVGGVSQPEEWRCCVVWWYGSGYYYYYYYGYLYHLSDGSRVNTLWLGRCLFSCPLGSVQQFHFTDGTIGLMVPVMFWAVSLCSEPSCCLA